MIDPTIVTEFTVRTLATSQHEVVREYQALGFVLISINPLPENYREVELYFVADKKRTRITEVTPPPPPPPDDDPGVGGFMLGS